MAGKNLSEKNGMWKGNKAGIDAIHIWVAKRLKKPKICSQCKKRKVIDLANINQNYKRNLTDWKWICRRCHMKEDGRLEKFINRNKQPRPPIYVKCRVCGEKSKHAYLGVGHCCGERVRYYRKRRIEQTVSKLKNLSLEESIKKVRERFLN